MIKDIITKYLANSESSGGGISSRARYQALARVQPRLEESEAQTIERGAALLMQHYDIPGIPRGRFDAPEDAGPLVNDANDLSQFIQYMLKLGAGSNGVWPDKAFYLGVFLYDELHRVEVWRYLERGFEQNRKRAGILKLHTDYWIIKGDPYWHVKIAILNSQHFEGGRATFPTISFA